VKFAGKRKDRVDAGLLRCGDRQVGAPAVTGHAPDAIGVVVIDVDALAIVGNRRTASMSAAEVTAGFASAAGAAGLGAHAPTIASTLADRMKIRMN
jgi:hypothetical protein